MGDGMSLQLLDPYRDASSPIHDLDARFKLVFALGLVLIINLTPVTAWPAHLLYLGVILAISAVGRVAVKSLLARSMIGVPFVLMASLGLPFVREGATIASMPLPWGRLVVTDVGVLRFATVMVRAWLSLLVSITLVLTTHFVDIARALRDVGVPSLLSAVILLMYRYLFVLVDGTQRLLRAREARSVEVEGYPAGGSLRWRAQVTGRMIGTLFLRTYERSERIYQAMLARGYDGEIKTLRHERSDRRALALGGASLFCLALIALFTTLFW